MIKPKLRLLLTIHTVCEATVRPSIVLCNGDWARGDGPFNKSGENGVAALVHGRTDVGGSPLCSSLSVTACSLGNRGAMAIAKALCRRSLQELCLESCGIGNAGAVVVALALGEGALKRTRNSGTMDNFEAPSF